ncbi:MAG TPA: hypothetical protein VF635_12445 [Propionibacteriaceae bacterium]|jgi:hypothetical protein
MPTAAARPLLLTLRSVGNWVNLSTPLGLLVAKAGQATVRRHLGGLFLAEGYRLRFPVAGAFTVGNVIITASTWDELQHRCPQLLDHEEAHTWQYLYCFGLPYYLAYSACLCWSWLRTGNLASGNFFERQAGLDRGGYPSLPPRPLRTGLRSLLRPSV